MGQWDRHLACPVPPCSPQCFSGLSNPCQPYRFIKRTRLPKIGQYQAALSCAKACFQIADGARACDPQQLGLSERVQMTPVFSSSSDISAAHRAALQKKKGIL